MTGSEWKEARGDTVWLFSGEPGWWVFRYDVPTTHFFKLPSNWAPSEAAL